MSPAPVAVSIIARVGIVMAVLWLAAACAGTGVPPAPPAYRPGERIDTFSGQPLLRGGR